MPTPSAPPAGTPDTLESHLKAIEEIEKQELVIQDEIAKKRTERAILQAVHDSLKEAEDAMKRKR